MNHSKIRVVIFRTNICRLLIARIEPQPCHQELKNEELLKQAVQAVYSSNVAAWWLSPQEATCICDGVIWTSINHLRFSLYPRNK